MKVFFTKSIFGLIAVSTILFSFCDSSDRINIKEFYYPIDQLKEGKVYEYRTIDLDNNDTLFSRYTYAKTMLTDSGKFIIYNSYDQSFFNDQFVMEEVVGNGILAKKYLFMGLIPEQDELQVEEAKIVKNNAFPFSVVLNGGVTPMEMKLTDPRNPKEEIRLIRERRYMGDTIYTYKGVDLPAVVFTTNEIREFHNIDEGDFDNTTYATEIYAKGIGLISRKYNFGEAQMESALHDTYSMKKLESQASQYWGKEIKIEPLDH